jgi:UDP-4-amino-4,6-dideoxy-N-acetyl-beta-L-altrosamine transaminase
MIPYGRQEITEADIAAVEKVLRSDFLTQGSTVPRFEVMVANYCQAAHAVAVNSATSALHIACLALDLGPGDWLWTSPNTFVASANCARHCGARVDFVDIDPRTYNMSVDALATKLAYAEKNGLLPKVVVPVHFAGQPCDMPAIHTLSQQYGFKIIEDASHAIGAAYANVKVGSCVHSDITVFSFHPVKIITTGEGGMTLTNNSELAKRLCRLRTHGITSDRELMHDRPEKEIWNYQQIELGFNYRMTDIQAALGISQMSRLDDYVTRRNEIARFYDAELADLRLTLPWQSPRTESSYHLYPIRVLEARAKITQRQIYKALWESGVAVNLHYIPVHRHPYYENLGFKAGDFPEAEQFHREVISLPIYPGLTNNQQNEVRIALMTAL